MESIRTSHENGKSFFGNLETIPDELRQRRQWVIWEPRPRRDGFRKVPVHPSNDVPYDYNQPSNWLPFDGAVECVLSRPQCGIGFVFGHDRGMAGVDLDHCRDPLTGVLDPWCEEILASLPTYAEVSPSGTGVKLFTRGPLPEGRRRGNGLEMYDSGQFFTVTGWKLPASPTSVVDCREQIAALHRRWFGEAGEATAGPCNGFVACVDIDDAEIVRRAHAARNGAKFSRLWSGDWTGYPSQSEADMALCQLLFWWTGNPSRIDTLFRQSGLYRAKWDSRRGLSTTYGSVTISRIVNSVSSSTRSNIGFKVSPLCLYVVPNFLGEMVGKITEKLGWSSVPEKPSEKRKVLECLCECLGSGGRKFCLPVELLGRVLRLSHSTVSKWLAFLIATGKLRLVKPANRKGALAAVYCWDAVRVRV